MVTCKKLLRLKCTDVSYIQAANFIKKVLFMRSKYLRVYSRNVFFFLGYEDLNSRKETRESAWRSPGWDECVAYTVPLIREMHCRIMVPTDFSPTQ